MKTNELDELDVDDLSFLQEFLKEDVDDSSFSLVPTPAEIVIPSFQQNAMNHIAFSSSPRSPVRSGAIAKKCTQIFLGGTQLTPGLTIFPDEPHFCDNMQCLSCDHIVLRFPDSTWAKDTDYLFLRNNYPDKVDKKLVRNTGWCAFCCQCTFCEEKEVRRLNSFSNNWVCRGHKK